MSKWFKLAMVRMRLRRPDSRTSRRVGAVVLVLVLSAGLALFLHLTNASHRAPGLPLRPGYVRNYYGFLFEARPGARRRAR